MDKRCLSHVTALTDAISLVTESTQTTTSLFWRALISSAHGRLYKPPYSLWLASIDKVSVLVVAKERDSDAGQGVSLAHLHTLFECIVDFDLAASTNNVYTTSSMIGSVT